MRIIYIYLIILILIILNGIQEATTFKIDNITLILLLVLSIPFIAQYLLEFEIPGVGKFKLRKEIEKLENEQKTSVYATIDSIDELSNQVLSLEEKLQNILKIDNITLRSNQEKEDLKKLFEKFSLEFTNKTREKTMQLKDRILTINKLEQIGSKIGDLEFLRDKLRNGDEGDRVGAAASLRILRKKEAFDDLLLNLSYSRKGGSYVRYRVVEALNALIKSNQLETEEIDKLISELSKQKSKEKNLFVKRYINGVIASIINIWGVLSRHEASGVQSKVRDYRMGDLCFDGQ